MSIHIGLIGGGMTGNERKIKRRVQLITASSMAFFFCLLLTLAVQLVIIGNQKKMERSLKAAQIQLQQELEKAESDELYYLTERFIDEYALRELGYGRSGSTIFK